MDRAQTDELRRMLRTIDERLLRDSLSAAKVATFRTARERMIRLLNAADVGAGLVAPWAA